LAEALNFVQPKLVPDLLIEREEFSRNPRTLTDILTAEDEFARKIWYNRHQIRKEKIEAGEIKIVERLPREGKYRGDLILRSIWEGAKKSARNVEATFGKGSLLWNDFEWGMLNGKLSALRWVLGEDWDELYT
jgi:hypothetical protein